MSNIKSKKNVNTYMKNDLPLLFHLHHLVGPLQKGLKNDLNKKRFTFTLAKRNNQQNIVIHKKGKKKKRRKLFICSNHKKKMIMIQIFKQ